MTLLEKLDYLMAKKGLNKSGLSQLSGIPYTTIDGLYKKGYENTKLSTIRKLAAALEVSLDYLIDERDPDTPSTIQIITMELSEDEKEIIDNFRQLNEEGQEKVFDYVSDLVAVGRYIKDCAYKVGG